VAHPKSPRAGVHGVLPDSKSPAGPQIIRSEAGDVAEARGSAPSLVSVERLCPKINLCSSRRELSCLSMQTNMHHLYTTASGVICNHRVPFMPEKPKRPGRAGPGFEESPRQKIKQHNARWPRSGGAHGGALYTIICQPHVGRSGLGFLLPKFTSSDHDCAKNSTDSGIHQPPTSIDTIPTHTG
jgi:hypothetical protein